MFTFSKLINISSNFHVLKREAKLHAHRLNAKSKREQKNKTKKKKKQDKHHTHTPHYAPTLLASLFILHSSFFFLQPSSFYIFLHPFPLPLTALLTCTYQPLAPPVLDRNLLPLAAHRSRHQLILAPRCEYVRRR